MRSYPILLGVILATVISSLFITTTARPNEINKHFIKAGYNDLSKESKQQVDCLAENIYHEAKSEPVKGQIAVALVTINRVVDDRFPKDICLVVKQRTKSGDRIICQFSWHCMKVRLNRNSETYQQVLKRAIHVYLNYNLIDDFTKGSLYFHADHVNPRWNLRKTVQIGRHIFYTQGG